MAIKDANLFTNFESVSKTKIRGVLALLKHGEMLNTSSSGVEGIPVNLILAEYITSYDMLRHCHDQYLLKFSQENRVFLPKYLWNEIIWKKDHEFRIACDNRMKTLLNSISLFYHNRQVTSSLPSNLLSKAQIHWETPITGTSNSSSKHHFHLHQQNEKSFYEGISPMTSEETTPSHKQSPSVRPNLAKLNQYQWNPKVNEKNGNIEMKQWRDSSKFPTFNTFQQKCRSS